MRLEGLASWLRPITYLGRNPTTLTGVVLTTKSALAIVAYWLYVLVLGGGAERYPYAGIVIFLILPAVFVLGLILMPVGGLLRRHQLAKKGELPTIYPKVELTGKPLGRNTDRDIDINGLDGRGRNAQVAGLQVDPETDVDSRIFMKLPPSVAPASRAGVNCGKNCPPRIRTSPLQRSRIVISYRLFRIRTNSLCMSSSCLV